MNLELEAYKASFDIKDIVRERLRGIRPNRPDEESILQIHLAGLDDASRLAFLSKAYDIIKNNETLKTVILSLIVEAEHKAMIYSVDMEEVNFNRATVNGIMVLEEELLRLGNMYVDEKELSKDMTEEERLSAL